MPKELNFKTTGEIKVPNNLIGQVIGQENVIKIIQKAAKQRRNVLLIGESGTGKSLSGQALAELLPKEKLVDILSYPNPEDDNNPIIRTLPKGQGKKIIQKAKIQSMSSLKNQNILFFGLLILAIITPWWVRRQYGDILAAASLIGSMIFIAAFVIFMNLNKRMKMSGSELRAPKLLVNNAKTEKSPFYDASGSQIDALLGSVLHDPLQSFSSEINIPIAKISKNGMVQIQNKSISKTVNKLLDKHTSELIKKGGYEATYTNDELKLIGEINLEPEPIQVISVNKYQNKHKNLIKITTESGKQLIITPEHKVAVKRFKKIIYKKAESLTKLDKVVTI